MHTSWMFRRNINPSLSAITPTQLVRVGVMAFQEGRHFLPEPKANRV